VDDYGLVIHTCYLLPQRNNADFISEQPVLHYGCFSVHYQHLSASLSRTSMAVFHCDMLCSNRQVWQGLEITLSCQQMPQHQEDYWPRHLTTKQRCVRQR